MTRTMLVTGGSAGIGAATVRLAAQRGFRVAFSYRSSKIMADALVAEVEAAGGEAMAVKADAASEAETTALFQAVHAAYGPIHALVNNAGITGAVATIETLGMDTLDEVLAINVRGTFLATRAAIGHMATDKGGEGGAIVNLSSVASSLGGAGAWVHYAASKGAVDSFTIGAAKELAPRGIRINAVHPGLIDTEIHAKAGLGDRLAKLAATVPMGRIGTADEVARAILFLISNEASYITGAMLSVGGGR